MTLRLFPNLLAPGTESLFPVILTEKVRAIHGLFAESMQGGRRFLSYFFPNHGNHIPITLLQKKPTREDYLFYFEPFQKNEIWGLVTDAGLPCIADPGAGLVRYAREHGYPIEAYPGPSALFLTLMLSGIPSQRFVFKGYPSSHPQDREREFKEWEKESYQHQTSILFIEAPHRNQHTFDSLVNTLHPTTLLCIAHALTTPHETVQTMPMAQWDKKHRIPKEPTLFMFCRSC